MTCTQLILYLKEAEWFNRNKVLKIITLNPTFTCPYKHLFSELNIDWKDSSALQICRTARLKSTKFGDYFQF